MNGTTKRTKKAAMSINRTSLLMLLSVILLTGGFGGCLEPTEEPTVDDDVTLECGDAALYSFDHDGCEAMDAVGDGACYCALGFAWNGSGCDMVAGCECAGEDCDSLTESEEACLAAHESCREEDPDDPPTPGFMCSSEALFSADHEVCDAMDAVGDESCWCVLGFAWNGSECEMLTGCECLGSECDSLTHSIEECEAAHDTCTDEPAPDDPPTPGFMCGADELHSADHDRCEAMDAVGEGACYCHLGFAWNGTECVGVGGCECVGEDCDSLAHSIEECEALHEGCEE